MSVGTKSIDKSGFDACFEKYKDIIYRAAVRYTRNHSASEEIVQEVFFKLYLYLDYGEVENVRAWLLTTTKNLAYNYRRSSKWEVLVDTEEDGDEVFGYEEGTEDTFFRELMERENLNASKTIHGEILDALYQKNQRWYEAIVLVYGMKMPQKQAAESLGITLEVLHSMLYRSRNWVKKKYKVDFDNPKDT